MTVLSLNTKQKYGSLLAGNAFYDPGDFVSIATGTVAAGATASVITFSSIPTTYTHLQLRMFARATSLDTMYVRFNNDSGSTNYDNHRMNANGSTLAADSRTNLSALYISSRGYGISATASIGSAIVMDILDYGNTSKYKVTRTISGQEKNTTDGTSDIEITSGSWKSTSAVNRIDVSLATSTLAQYTHVALYGVKA
jgi:hypothetical protein